MATTHSFRRTELELVRRDSFHYRDYPSWLVWLGAQFAFSAQLSAPMNRLYGGSLRNLFGSASAHRKENLVQASFSADFIVATCLQIKQSGGFSRINGGL